MKEVRALLPIFVLQLTVFAGLDLFDLLLSGYPDQASLTRGLSYFEEQSFVSLIQLAITLGASMGLVVGEHDRGTLEFLDALPTSRIRVYTIKVFVALGVLWLGGPVAELLLAVLVHVLAPISLRPAFPIALLGPAALLHAAQLVFLMGVSLVLAYGRRFAWIIAALFLLWMHEYAEDSALAPWLSFDLLVRPSFEGWGWRVPWAPLWRQMLVGLGCYVVAGALFCFGSDRVVASLADLKDSLKGRVLLGLGALLSIAAWVGLFVVMARDDEGGGGGRADAPTLSSAKFGQWSTSRAVTERYVFVHPTELSSRIQPLVADADRLHEEVRRRFDVEAIDQISVDATRTLPGHGVLGLANWKAFRIDLRKNVDLDALRATLVHETAHVYAAHVSDRRLLGASRYTNLFGEGLAQHIQHAVMAQTSSRALDLKVAATVHAREHLTVEMLFDADALGTELDQDLTYPFGSAFVHALVLEYGGAAPIEIVKAFGRPEAPSSSPPSVSRPRQPCAPCRSRTCSSPTGSSTTQAGSSSSARPAPTRRAGHWPPQTTPWKTRPSARRSSLKAPTTTFPAAGATAAASGRTGRSRSSPAQRGAASARPSTRAPSGRPSMQSSAPSLPSSAPSTAPTRLPPAPPRRCAGTAVVPRPARYSSSWSTWASAP